MTVRARLGALWRALESEGIAKDSSCETCGGLCGVSRGIVVVFEDDRGLLSHCPACGNLLDERGVPAGYYEKGRMKPPTVIVITSPPTAPSDGGSLHDTMTEGVYAGPYVSL